MAKYTNKREGYKENNEYYTPKWLFEALNTTFDLDVASPTGGVDWVPARNYYDEKADGLVQPWYGYIWCNPPYSNPTPWIDKFIEHANGIMLTQVSKSNAFLRLWNESDAIMFAPRNIMFEHKDYGRKGIFMPVALFAIGHQAVTDLHNSKINKVR